MDSDKNEMKIDLRAVEFLHVFVNRNLITLLDRINKAPLAGLEDALGGL